MDQNIIFEKKKRTKSEKGEVRSAKREHFTLAWDDREKRIVRFCFWKECVELKNLLRSVGLARGGEEGDGQSTELEGR